MMKPLLLATALMGMIGSALAQTPLPYSQDFEDPTFPPIGWQTFASSSPNWVRDTNASGYGIGEACTSFDNFNTPAGSYHGIRLPSMSFTGVTQPYIRFDIAYAKKPTGSSDQFGLYWSDNGTSNWQSIVNYSGANLITAPDTADPFVPTPSQWETKTRSLSSLAGEPFVRLAIEDNCSNGNMMYFDNVIVFDSASSSGIANVLEPNALIYPNPFGSSISVTANSGQRIAAAELVTATGAIATMVEANDAVLTIEASALPPGVYFLRLYSDDGSVENRKVVKM